MIYGVDFKLDENGRLTFEPAIAHPEPDIRRLTDARHVLYYADLPLDERPLYYMYRGVMRPEDEDLFLQHQIRYDLTVLLPGKLGSEYYKTVGHFHPLKPGTAESYPEYYEVLEGEALYLLQQNNRSGDVAEIQAVAAQKGDKVFIPPNYGHVTINAGDSPLVMANLIERNFASLYEPFRDKRGAAYYYVEGENGRGEFIKNTNYHNSVGLKMVCAPNLEAPISFDPDHSGLYEAFIHDPSVFKILR